ncbi:MAG TPA: hypothetical protein VMV07_15430 [Streptosporangiaceae bacterium]|nr:hypothetical protein [Streptosporangiaceae bacterium]
MTSSHLSEMEGWPGEDASGNPADRIVLGKAPGPEGQQETTAGPPVFPPVGEPPCQAHPSVADAEPGLQELVSANVVSPGDLSWHGPGALAGGKAVASLYR